METVVGTGVTKVTEPLVDSVLRQIGYIWNYQDNLQSLRAQVQNLKGEMQVLKHDMENARQKGEQIEDVVKNWLKDANEKIEASEKILEDNDRANHFCFMGCCPNMKTRHQLSRKANKKTQVLVEVRKNRKFDKISYRTALKGIGPPKDYEAFESRMLILNQMLEALKDVDVTMIGVYGMGGVGKTTLAKKLAKQVEEDGIFKVVVIATVTSNVDLKRIQQEIAEWLRFPLEAEVTAVRAALLCSRLEQEEKILVILDEVWAQMKLEDIGIPLGTEHKGCKILMTSRNLNVLHEMGTERNFKLQVLEDEEARELFEKKVGTLKHSQIKPMTDEVAKRCAGLIKPMTNEVAKRCAGLPISIVAGAPALKNKGLEEWKDALERLKRSGEDDMDKQVQSCFDLSYRYLENDEIKLLLRLSALFLSGRVDQLLKYVLGLSLFEGCRNLEETRNRLHKYVNDLKSSCLLLEGQRDGEVKMHDVVRSFAISTASRDHHVFTVAYDKVLEWPPKSKLEQCTAISLYFTEIPELPTTLECQQLQSFLLVYPGDVPSISQKPATASTSSGEVILEDESATLSLLSSKKIQFPNLVDLKLASINVEKIWPSELTELSPWITNLTSLIIDTCENLSYLFTSSIVESLAKLINIEIRDCKSMKEVIVTNREEMKSIMLFPKLVSMKLKGLPSLRRFCTAKFIECPSLKVLWIENCPQLQAFISSSRRTYAGTSGQANSTLFDEKILFPNLENLRITNMHTLKMIWNDELWEDSFCRLKVLEVKHGKELLKVFPSKQLLRFKNLEILMVNDCNLVEEVFDLQVLMKIQEETDVVATTQTQLRFLNITGLPNLKNVWNGDPSGILSFRYVQNVYAWNCPNLKELFPFSIAQSLPQLELLNIDGCGMEEIVAKEERAEATPKFTFSRLKSLTLWRLYMD
ncbi:hypothetical protein JCGZ_23411 [Jatropha curcas]|uniref:AAA+ ATPase domain-containing protein n=1 Tax=Jatropha curcas TaxID=180498 RepID=A0A067JL55_JATCU|nr:hypothetical protein JCGZ_23411 [Jatropha curcas]